MSMAALSDVSRRREATARVRSDPVRPGSARTPLGHYQHKAQAQEAAQRDGVLGPARLSGSGAVLGLVPGGVLIEYASIIGCRSVCRITKHETRFRET
jgi:hypothetical protein